MSSTDNAQWMYLPVHTLDVSTQEKARLRQNTLTKPLGSLGDLEKLILKFSAWQGLVCPTLNHIKVRVFAADHGVCSQGVSAFPQVVTTQMIANFIHGGAAISVLSQHMGADFLVVNMGVVHPVADHEKLMQKIVAKGTADFSRAAAMTPAQCEQAMWSGREAVGDVSTTQLFIGGEMGIGNTTSASALYAALLNLPPIQVVGPGTGVDDKTKKLKCDIVAQALDRHHEFLNDPLMVLSRLGGFEIAALVGAYIYCAQKGVPILVDGFISTAAALVASKINPRVSEWFIFSHQSAEPGHGLALAYFEHKGLLNLGLRLGEGSGAALAVPLIQSALLLHQQMATFDESEVSAR